MKAFRIVITIVIVLAALVALAVVVALIPAVQTWAVRKAVASQPGMKLDVGRVAAGFTSADLQNIRLVKDGIVLSATRVTASYSAWDYLLHKRITVDDLTASDLLIDAQSIATAPSAARSASPNPPTQSSTPSSTEPPAAGASSGNNGQPFDGILNQLQLPFDVQIHRFDIPGRALLPNQQTAGFEIHGSDITPNQRGTIDWKVDLTSAATDASIHALHTTGTATVHITTERRIDLLQVNAVAAVEGKNIPADQIKADLRAEQPAAGGNEGYSANVALVRGNTAEPLVTMAGQYDASAHVIGGVWNVRVRADQLSAILTGLGLPDIAADGSGKFSMKPNAGTGSADGELRSTVSHLERLSPQLAVLGSLDVHIAFNGNLANQVARLEQLAIDATDANGHRLADIRTLQQVGFSLADKHVSFANAQADLAHITIDSLPLVWAQPFAKPLTIDNGTASMVLAVAAEADGSHVRLTTVQPLTLSNVTVENAGQKIADRMTLSVKPQADYASDRLQAQLDDLSVSTPDGDTVTGRLTADITNVSGARRIAFTTDTQAKFVQLLKPYVNIDTGPMTVATKSQGILAGDTLQFAASNTRITDQSGQLVAGIDLQQPLTLNLQDKSIHTPKPEAESLRVTLGQVPLAWAQAFVANSKLDGQVTGGTIGITTRSLDDLSASTTSPISVHGVSVAMNNQPMLRNVDLSADFSATKHGTSLAYEVRRIEAKQGGATLLSLSATGEAKLEAKPAINTKGTLTADLGALAQQPIAASSDSLARGTLDATFDAAIGDAIQAKATVTARDLVAKQGNRSLGTAVLDASATLQPDGSSLIRIPFTLTNGTRKSDLSVDGKLARTGNTLTFNGTVTSNQLVVDDLQPLAALAPSSNAPATAPTTTRGGSASVAAAPASRPTPTSTSARPGAAGSSQSATVGSPAAQAFWSAVGGKIDLDLKKILYGKDYVISGVRGSADVTPNRLALNSLEGQLKDSPFKANATVDFNAGQPQPYTLTGALNVTGFDVGAFLQARNPNAKPQLETKLTIAAKFDGKGAGPADLAKHVYGVFDVAGSQGVLRILSQKAGTAINTVAGAEGIAQRFGLSLGQNTDEVTSALTGLAQKFGELPFDKVTAHAERGPDLNLKVTHLEFISADMRLTGGGVIKNEPGVPVDKQPMQLTLSLGAKGDIAFLLNKVHALSGKKDDEGYEMMSRAFTIGGSASQSESSDFWKSLAQVGVQQALPALENLFRR